MACHGRKSSAVALSLSCARRAGAAPFGCSAERPSEAGRWCRGGGGALADGEDAAKEEAAREGQRPKVDGEGEEERGTAHA